MGIGFNLVVAPRPYVGFYRPAHPVFFAASPVFFRPALDPSIIAAAVGMNALSGAFNKHASRPQPSHGNPMYAHPPGGANFTTQQVIPPQAQPAPAKPPEPPKVATPLADALDGAKGLKKDSTDLGAVATLQKFLKKAGYGEMLGKTGAGHDGVDGIFKGRTESALEKFQTDNNLEKTGIMDEATLKKMHEVEQKIEVGRAKELEKSLRETIGESAKPDPFTKYSSWMGPDRRIYSSPAEFEKLYPPEEVEKLYEKVREKFTPNSLKELHHAQPAAQNQPPESAGQKPQELAVKSPKPAVPRARPLTPGM